MPQTAVIDRCENTQPLGVAVVGAGHWGPNLARNIAAAEACSLRWVCDLQVERAHALAASHDDARAAASLDAVLGDPQVDAVVVSTPAATHAAIARHCLASGRHVLVAKPLACSRAEAAELVALAREHRRVLLCDHTYCFAPIVRRIRAMIGAGELGGLRYLHSVRVGRGRVQPDVDVFWDLAHHDLAILDYILPPHETVAAVSAVGADPVGLGRSCAGDLTVRLAGGALAQIHVSWLRPHKVRTMFIGGTAHTLVWNDVDPLARLRVYPGIALDAARRGHAPAPAGRPVGSQSAEPLQEVVREFIAAIRDGVAPSVEVAAELRVLAVLEAVSQSVRCAGALVPVAQEYVVR